MSERSLRQSYEAIIRAVAAADKDALDGLIAENIVDHNAVPGQAPGRDGIIYWMAMMHDAFADLTGVVEDTVVEGPPDERLSDRNGSPAGQPRSVKPRGAPRRQRSAYEPS